MTIALRDQGYLFLTSAWAGNGSGWYPGVRVRGIRVIPAQAMLGCRADMSSLLTSRGIDTEATDRGPTLRSYNGWSDHNGRPQDRIAVDDTARHITSTPQNMRFMGYGTKYSRESGGLPGLVWYPFPVPNKLRGHASIR